MWLCGNGEGTLNLGGMGLGVRIPVEDEWTTGPMSSFFFKSSLNYAICGESFVLSFMFQNDQVCGLIFTSMVGSHDFSAFRPLIMTLGYLCRENKRE